MISSEVERTLVKSPPELWTELSNPDALARHLGEFGDIRITRVEPEHAVEWEAADTAGTVRIKPSGWGTKVTLTATREIATSKPAVTAELGPEPPVTAEHAPERALDPVAHKAIELDPELTPEPEPNVAANAMVELALAPAASSLRAEPSRGFFSRLFGGRRRRRTAEDLGEVVPGAREPPHTHAAIADAGVRSPQPAPEQPDPFAAVREALSPETMMAVDPFSTPQAAEAESPDERIETSLEQTADVSAALQEAEEVAAEQVTAVLTSVLDRLGAAHHRPFSRA